MKNQRLRLGDSEDKFYEGHSCHPTVGSSATHLTAFSGVPVWSFIPILNLEWTNTVCTPQTRFLMSVTEKKRSNLEPISCYREKITSKIYSSVRKKNKLPGFQITASINRFYNF